MIISDHVLLNMRFEELKNNDGKLTAAEFKELVALAATDGIDGDGILAAEGDVLYTAFQQAREDGAGKTVGRYFPGQPSPVPESAKGLYDGQLGVSDWFLSIHQDGDDIYFSEGGGFTGEMVVTKF
jgi:hypothetical protein